MSKKNLYYEYNVRKINWDTDGAHGEDVDSLPESITIHSSTPMTEDDIAEDLSNEFGFCHFGFEWRERVLVREPSKKTAKRTAKGQSKAKTTAKSAKKPARVSK